MIINSESSQSDWLAWTGTESAWPCGFQALAAEHVLGELRDASQHSQALTRGTHFDVQLGTDGTVTAIKLAGMIVTHGQVRFHRQTPALKGVDFINLSSYSADIHDYYYAADAMRGAELRRDLGQSLTGGLDVTADEVSYPGGNVGLGAVVNVRQGLDTLTQRGLAGLPDVNVAPGPAVDQYRIAWNNSSGKFVLVPQGGQSGSEIVAAINTELGGTTWQQGGTGGGGGGTITTGSNVGTGGAIGVYKAASGVQLQFYGFRGVNGVVAQFNASTNSIDYSLDLTFADGRYVKAAQLDDVAFTGAYGSLSGVPTLGALSAKDVIAFVDIVATAIATLADAQAGTNPSVLMTASRVRDAILAQAIASTRRVIAGNGLTGGGDLSADRTLTIGTPSSVTGTSANTVSAGTHTHDLVITAANVIPAGVNNIGSYAFCTTTGATVALNGTIAGSSLNYCTTAGNSGGSPSGTWRNMGGSCNSGVGSIFLRIS